MQLNDKIADWAAAVTFSTLPESVVISTKRRILDIVGCMMGGASHPDAQASKKVAEEAYPGAIIRSVPYAVPMSVAGAALVNGTAALVLEFDDSHLESAIHVGSPVISAALPFAQFGQRQGKDLIAAVAIGNELTCRLGMVAPGKFHQNGFHPTGIFGTFGAIYAAAHCLKLDRDQIANAAGIGGSLSGALMASWEDGSAAKSLHAGFAAMAAVNAAMCAKSGITGPKGVFDGRFGFFKAHVQDNGFAFAFDRVTDGLGERWEALDIAPKVYPCGHYIQPLIDAALTLQDRYGIAPEQIVSLRCSMPEFVVQLVAEPVAEKRRPKTSFHGRFSLQHSMAEALINRTLNRESFKERNLRDPAFNAIADKVEVRVDPHASDRRKLGGTVEIDLSDGRTVSHTVDNMRGMPQNPLSESDLIIKFRGNAEGVLPEDRIARIIDAISSLEQVESVADMVSKA